MKKQPPKPEDDVLAWVLEEYIPRLEQENADLKRQLDNYFCLQSKGKDIHSKWKRKMARLNEEEEED